MWHKLKWIADAYGKYKLRMAVMIVLTPIHAAVFMMDPQVLKYIFDAISGETPRLLFKRASRSGSVTGVAMVIHSCGLTHSSRPSG